MQSPEKISPDTHSVEEVIELLGLEELDEEGGYFRRTAGSKVWVKRVMAAGEQSDQRRAYSIIYFLLTSVGFSAMHRLKTDEVWCWHAGDRIESLRLHQDGRGEWIRMSDQVRDLGRVHDVVRESVWQGTRLEAGGRWALVSCIVAPEFHWDDFELADPVALAQLYPNYSDDISQLTRVDAVEGKK